jgi:hypothetical protein
MLAAMDARDLLRPACARAGHYEVGDWEAARTFARRLIAI